MDRCQSCTAVTVILVAAVASCVPRVEADAPGRTPAPMALTDYRPYIKGGPSAAAWFGRRTALILEGERPDARDAKVMAAICAMLDGLFDAYDRVTGRRPELTDPFQGRIRVEVSPQVGGGLAYHGRLGYAVNDRLFQGLYDRVKAGGKTLDHVFFYETNRNYWMPDMASIDYATHDGPDSYGWWTVGFNNVMAVVLAREVPGVEDMTYYGQGSKQFAAGMEANLDEYLAHPDKYGWDNAWCVKMLPWKANTSVNDLMTGLVLRLQREHGGLEFVSRLYREIPRQPPPRDRSDYLAARDNFYAAASLAAGKDLGDFFTKGLRWRLSKATHDRVLKELRARRTAPRRRGK
ncbi:hypothetical protein OJF2_44730 [Aquisphaera giovannonii]|uniref:Uncharacterized protein n=1 Tax=Aquisphaera giovannonii TaxID=406548 RepID=A0A5B9W5H0_9BACT|nr:hypothetical protein [Aquisphaera giovannonii]QEH35916.1 hypothetical protein OJF2_44730 [Aquisphaera giovannonii]